MPTVNEHYWSPKLARNVARDAETTSALTAAGWTVLRFWEHESIADIADAVEAAVRDAQRRRRPCAVGAVAAGYAASRSSGLTLRG